MSDRISEFQVKIKIIESLELAYQSNGDVTAKLIKSKGMFNLSVDQNGHSILSGKAGIVRFSTDGAKDKFGIDFKYISIMFSGNRDGKLHYAATLGYKRGPKLTVKSILDIENLILSCTGLLCRAAQMLKNRHKVIDRSLNQ